MAVRDPIERLISPALRAALARRELLVRRPLAGLRHGVHRSLRPGVGRDFRDYRAYVPGDDLRRLDWRAAARSQRLVVRQTESEEELDLVAVIDGSAAMDYGEGEANKWRRGGTVVAALASLALRQGDRVGYAIGRGGEIEDAAIDPVARRDRLGQLAVDLAQRAPAGDCPWERLLDAVAPRLRRRALLVVVSDFLDPGGQGLGRDESHGDASGREADESLLRGLTLLRGAGHDVALVQILHRDELEFPWTQLRVHEFEDPRGRRPTVEGPGASLREAYLARLGQHLRWLEQGCERGGLLLARVVSDGDPGPQLLDLLARLAGSPADAVSHEGGGREGRGPT